MPIFVFIIGSFQSSPNLFLEETYLFDALKFGE